MSVDVVILLVVAIGCASVAWPASMPTRIRWSFAALSAALLGTASAIAVMCCTIVWRAGSATAKPSSSMIERATSGAPSDERSWRQCSAADTSPAAPSARADAARASAPARAW